ncbi:DUF3667 domain-containing protein [Novosphingobium sp. PhB165]|uniref:DUF3667 domain-containing protein n=1 Tax=Novosphingobium sp. PhB165 TaxID=2485105 RepID=UPI001A9F88D0|nr:DUF3667 domain-containing protein [Novosphingobium sp. PhB165]
MSDLTESLAEMGQGAFAARAVEPHAGEGADGGKGHTHESACLNCGTTLVGSHCHACGQAAHVHRTLGAFFHDLMHGVFHFEGKIWRTLPMLIRHPGKLTREYIDGRRASYVSPIALFLFCVFLMFGVFHATEEPENLGAKMTSPTELAKAIASSEKRIDGLKTRRKALAAAGKDTDQIDKEIDSKETALGVMRDTHDAVTENGGDVQQISDIRPIQQAVAKFRENPDLAAYKLQTYAYKYSWALIPISVPFLWLLFPFSRRFHLYEHTVFATYSICFMTLLAVVAMLLGAVGAGTLEGLLFFVPPFHMYAQLKGTYGLARRGALWRTALLVIFACTALLLFFVALTAQT